MKYDTLEQYRTGTTSEGHTQFSIPLLPDEDGFFGRECPNEDCDTKYFKIGRTIPDGMENAAEDFSHAELTCPYCGTVENIQRFFTQAQVDWIKSMMISPSQSGIAPFPLRAPSTANSYQSERVLLSSYP